jgi:hypothetical protein
VRWLASSGVAWVSRLSVALGCASCSADVADGMPAFGALATGGGGSSAGAPNQPGSAGSSSPSSPVTPGPGVSEPNPPVNTPIAGNAGAGGSSSGPAPGAAGAGGSAGSSPAPGAAGAPNPDPGNQPPPDPPGDAFFFDDFESGAAGTQPSAWTRWIDYTTMAGNDASRAQFALLDDQDSVSGDKSVHFHVTQGTQPAQLTVAVPPNTKRLYVRAFVKSSMQLGARQFDTPSNHETLIALRSGSGKADFELRFGEAKGALGFNIVGPDRSDAVAPPMAQWGSGPSMAPNEWHCVEVDFLNDTPGSPQAHASVDGQLVRSVTSLADWHVTLSNQGVQWLEGMFGEVVIGWQSFSNPAANDVWMDDVVLSNAPIGCE